MDLDDESKNIQIQVDMDFVSTPFIFTADQSLSVSKEAILQQRQCVENIREEGMEQVFEQLAVLYQLEDRARFFRDVSTQVSSNGKSQKGTQKDFVGHAKQVKDVGVGSVEKIKKDVCTGTSKTRYDQIDFDSFGSRQLKAFTGASRDLFNFFLEALGSSITSTKKMTRDQKLFLFLVKIKLNVPFAVLAAMFCVSEGVAGHWFHEVKVAMAQLARSGVWWFDKETVKARLPQQM